MPRRSPSTRARRCRDGRFASAPSLRPRLQRTNHTGRKARSRVARQRGDPLRRFAGADRRAGAQPATELSFQCDSFAEDEGEAMALRRNGRPGSGELVLMGFAEAYAAIETAWSLQAGGFK